MSFINRNWPRLGRDLFVNLIIASALIPRGARWRLLRAYGMKVEPSTISPGVWFGGPRVTIGRGTFVSYGCLFDAAARIEIGRNCDVAMRVAFVTGSHEMGTHSRRAGKSTARPIFIGDGCWIGARAMILPGVSVGAGTVIAAGSVVAADCEPNGLYGGVPARKIRSLGDDRALQTEPSVEVAGP